MSVTEAEAKAVAARERMNQTAARLQAKLEPQAIAAQAREAGLTAAKTSLDCAKSNPAAVAGGVAFLGLILNRRRIARLFQRRR